MDCARHRLFLEVLSHEEYVEVEPTLSPDGKVIGGKVIEGTRSAFLHLRSPDGTEIRVEIPPGHLDHLLGLMFSDTNVPPTSGSTA